MSVTIDDSRPYPRPDSWDDIEVEHIPTIDLVLSQHHISTFGFLWALGPAGAEPIEAVEWQGRVHVHDGHHRTLVALARARPVIRGKLYRPS